MKLMPMWCVCARAHGQARQRRNFYVDVMSLRAFLTEALTSLNQSFTPIP